MVKRLALIFNMKQDEQQNIIIAELKKDVDFIKTDIKEIKHQVSNELPHFIQSLKDDFYKYKLSNNKWIIGIFVTLLFLLLGVIVNLLVK